MRPEFQDAGLRRGDGFSWRDLLRWRIVRLAPVILACLYGAGVGAAWGILRHVREYETIQFGSVALPWRWHEIRTTQGRELIARARASIERGRFGDGYFALQVGVARYPADLDARLLLSALHQRVGREAVAQSILEGGIPFLKDNTVYARAVLDWHLRRDRLKEADRVLALLDAKTDLSPEVLRVVYTAKATVHFMRRDYAKMEAVIKAGSIEQVAWVGEMLALSAWEAGDSERAKALLMEVSRGNPESERLQSRLTGWLYTSGRKAEALALLEARHISAIGYPGRHLDVLRDFAKFSSQEVLGDRFRAFARNHTGDNRALLAGAALAASLGRRDLVEVALGGAVLFGNENAEALSARVEAAVRSGSAAEALAMVRDAQGARPEWLEFIEPNLHALAAAAAHVLGDEATYRLHFERFRSLRFQDPGLPLAVAELFFGLGERIGASELVDAVLVIDQSNLRAVSLRVLLDLESADAERIGRLAGLVLETSRIPKDVAEAVARRLDSDLCLFVANRGELRQMLQNLIEVESPVGAGAGALSL